MSYIDNSFGDRGMTSGTSQDNSGDHTHALFSAAYETPAFGKDPRSVIGVPKDSSINPADDHPENDLGWILKTEAALRLTPELGKIKEAMTPEVAERLKRDGLVSDPEQFKRNLIDAIAHDDKALAHADERAKGDFPILDGYMATGLIDAKQRKELLDEQHNLRAAWRAENPDAPAGAEEKQFKVGDLLREKFGAERVDAADALLKALQPNSQAGDVIKVPPPGQNYAQWLKALQNTERYQYK